MPRSRPLVALVFLAFVSAACTSTSAGVTIPETTPSSIASPSASPSPSPSPTPTGPLTITAVPVHNGEVAQAFSPITLTAEGGVQPYSWAVGTGALPAGLALSAAGVISGQVTKDGTFKFTVAVADSGGSQASKATAITVFKALKVTAKCTQTCVIGKGCAKCGSFGTVTGGQTPYAYKVTGGAVPSGMKLSALSLVGGFPAGSYSLTVQVSDKLGARASVSANWSVYASLAFIVGTACTNPSTSGPAQCVATGWGYKGGNPNTTPQLVVLSVACTAGCTPPSNMPPGWVMTAKGGAITFSAAAPDCSLQLYQAVLTVALKDTSACASTAVPQAKLTVNMPTGC